MKCVVIGASRKRNGIGEYYVKFLSQLGVEIVGVVNSSLESAQQSCETLNKEYSLSLAAFSSLDEIQENVDFVVIVSPSRTHAQYLEHALALDIPVFCEKPFVWDDKEDVGKETSELVQKFDKKNLFLMMNSQWIYFLKGYEQLFDALDVDSLESFSVTSQSPFPGTEMIPETLPHVLSLLYHVFGEGKAEHAKCDFGDTGNADVSFDYVHRKGTCAVQVALDCKDTQPRVFSFGFNGQICEREIDLTDYSLSLAGNGKTVSVDDPLKQSIATFLSSLKSGDRHIPLNSIQNIMDNVWCIYQCAAEKT